MKLNLGVLKSAWYKLEILMEVLIKYSQNQNYHIIVKIISGRKYHNKKEIDLNII